MMNDVLTELTDVALRVKEAFENKDVAGLAALFTPDARINSAGRFFGLEAFIARLAELMESIEQQSLDITHIEESHITEQASFVTYLVEISWVNPRTWEESVERGAMSLELVREKKIWLIRGFTFSRRPPVADDSGDDVKPPTGGGVPSGSSGLDSLFSFWY